MRKWWLALVVAAAMLFAGGRRVLALPYDKLLFEGVSWQPLASTYGFALAPPKELWMRVNTSVNVFFYFTKNGIFDFNKQNQSVTFKRIENEMVVPNFGTEVAVGAVTSSAPNTGYFKISPTVTGTREYQLSTKVPITDEPVNRTLTLHVVEDIPSDLTITADGLQIFDFVPVQLFPIDSAGHKYAVPMFFTEAPVGPVKSDANLAGLVLPSSGTNTNTGNIYRYAYAVNAAQKAIDLGRFQIIHQPEPVRVDQRGEATVQLPVIVPPFSQETVRLAWQGPDQVRHVLPIGSDGTVRFSGLTPASFPMDWRIEYSKQPFSSEAQSDKAASYTNIQGQFTTPLTLDLPVTLAPLFTGTYTLQQLAEGPVSVLPAWESLAITASGRWLLQLDIDAPVALPMRLRLGEQETGRGEPPLRVSGQDSQDVSLAASRLIIPQTRVLSPGTYTAQITFTLIRAPNP